MSKKGYFFLFLVSCLVFSVCLLIQHEPGYMDSEYYYGQGIQIAQGNFLNENFVWNFLNNQTAIPSSSFTFWMPFTSLFSAMGILLFGSTQFLTARILFLIAASFIPVFCAYFAEKFLPNKGAGYLAGVIAIFGGQFFSYYTITDTFVPYFILGGLFFWLIYLVETKKVNQKFNNWSFLLLGVDIGLMHLTRADGILWIVGGISAVFLVNRNINKENLLSRRLLNIIKLGLGYLVIMLPWYIRNIIVFKSLFPTGNSKNLLFTGYNDLVLFPASQITFERWIAGGLGPIFTDRLHSLGANILNFVSSGGLIFLFPFILIGVWKKRKETTVKLALIMLLVIYLSMSLLFPYAGERGGFFHSLASVQIIYWSLIPVGFVSFVDLGIKVRGWKYSRAWRGFGIIIIVGCILFTGITFYEKLVNGPEKQGNWNYSNSKYLAIDSEISLKFEDSASPIMVNDPPGYSLSTGRRSIAIPTGDPEAINKVAEMYDVKYLVVDIFRPDITNLLQTDASIGSKWIKFFANSEYTLYQLRK
jgi:hypothetical protein